MTNIESTRELLSTFRNYRNSHFSQKEAYKLTQLAIANICQALQGLVPKEAVIAACRNAKNPNAVSRALRNRLSPRYFKNL